MKIICEIFEGKTLSYTLIVSTFLAANVVFNTAHADDDLVRVICAF